jgi:hypothetical protein
MLGNAGELKERTIGVEAFGRNPSYDVNLDPVVRVTAAEVRRRLIQYYYDSNHAGELVIELPVGSYAPSFRRPASHSVDAGSEPLEAASEEPAGQAGPRLAPFSLTLRYWAMVSIALLLAAFAGFAIGRFKRPTQPSNLKRFWGLVTATPSKVTYCLGASADSNYAAGSGSRDFASLNVADVTTLARAIAALIPQNGAFRVLAASNASFEQLREGPVVLIGAYNNPWTMRVTQDLPIGFEYRRIVDRKGPQKRVWALSGDQPDPKHDYALVARIHDKVTGQPVIILAGIWAPGTEAASELVSNPVYLDALTQKAPRNWDQLNLEAVLETDVIDGDPGPPRVIAVETW